MKISLAMAIIGIVGMAILAYYVEPPEVAIGTIADDDLGRVVKIKGIVSGYYKTEEAGFFKISDSTGSIKVVVFRKSGNYNMRLEDSDVVTAIGKISIYKNEYEIVAESVKKV